jgi:DNA-binding MarR family transcriptional regulator
MARESAESAKTAVRIASPKLALPGRTIVPREAHAAKTNGRGVPRRAADNGRDGVELAAPGGRNVRYRVEDQIGYLLRRAHQRATSVFQSMIGDDEITPTQYSSLVKLLEHEELSQNRLGRLVAMDKATTQGVVRRLKARELLTSRPDPGDARRVLLKLTTAGRRLTEQLAANGPDVSREILKPLPPAQQKMLVELLRRIT